MLPPFLQVIQRLIATFEPLSLGYLVGGSVASSLYGVYRATNDVDIVIDLPLERVPRLVAALEADFYVDAEMIVDALQTRTSCNVLHLATMVKTDLFPRQAGVWEDQVWARKVEINLGTTEEPLLAWLPSPEDMILRKLDWYRLGGGVSDRQWNDILNMLRVQSLRLDTSYLQHWAEVLGLTPLLQRAMADATPPSHSG